MRLASLFSATRMYSQHADSPFAVAFIYNQEGLTHYKSTAWGSIASASRSLGDAPFPFLTGKSHEGRL
ncbi:hypothetical protein [Brevibacillus sp. MER 51]|uniref:hypothetical protein n=1 Tax=Brevibacillus sp. MER 51 TaxID=2939560 RepID=UPI00204232E5|nr:hypothetical protein [Brevibacillus sp. MER 51]MCM3145706.1 hypothetical protein [Brevibacillus sp. MER 51]